MKGRMRGGETGDEWTPVTPDAAAGIGTGSMSGTTGSGTGSSSTATGSTTGTTGPLGTTPEATEPAPKRRGGSTSPS
jgi:hypothetical protein